MRVEAAPPGSCFCPCPGHVWPATRPSHCPAPPYCPTPCAANLAGTPVGVVGQQYDLTYPTEHLGDGADALDKLVKGAGRCVVVSPLQGT